MSSALDVLPDELIIEILWVARALDVLRMKLVCRRLKEIIDSSTLLQYLIELHRDGFIPFPCGRREFRVRSLYAGGNSARESSENMKIDGYADKRLSSTTASLATTTSTTRDRVKANAIDLLNNLLNRRKRWSDFHLYPPRRCPPDDTQFRLYEFCGGYLAHCQGGEQTDSIIFQNLSKAGENGNENGPGMQELKIPVKCADFTFDLAQDLLVVVEARARLFPLHILGASTGTPHPHATKPYFDDLLLSREIPTEQADSTEIDVELTISGATVAIGYYPPSNNVISLHVVALDWKKGKCLINHNFTGAGSVTLLSPTVMAIINCSSSMIFPEIRLFDLSGSAFTAITTIPSPGLRPSLGSNHSTSPGYNPYFYNNIENDYENDLLLNPKPTVILTLPHFKPTGNIPLKMTYHSAFFLCGSSLSPQDFQDFQDFGDPNIPHSHSHSQSGSSDSQDGQYTTSSDSSASGLNHSGMRMGISSQCQRSGEVDIVPIVLRMTREAHTDPHYRIYLFVSKKFLLECVTERVQKVRQMREAELKERWERLEELERIREEKEKREKAELDGSDMEIVEPDQPSSGDKPEDKRSSLPPPPPTTTTAVSGRYTPRRASTPPTNSTHAQPYLSNTSRQPTIPTNTANPPNPYSHINKSSIAMLPPFKPASSQILHYKHWGKNHTRWINGTDLRSISRCSSYGSRFAFVVDPVENVDPASSIPVLCLFDFNARLWDPSIDGPCAPWDNPDINATYYQDGLLAGLAEDVTRGMHVKVRIFRKASARHWKDVMIDRDHVVVRLLSGFEVYTI